MPSCTALLGGTMQPAGHAMHAVQAVPPNSSSTVCPEGCAACSLAGSKAGCAGRRRPALATGNLCWQERCGRQLAPHLQRQLPLSRLLAGRDEGGVGDDRPLAALQRAGAGGQRLTFTIGTLQPRQLLDSCRQLQERWSGKHAGRGVQQLPRPAGQALAGARRAPPAAPSPERSAAP